VRACYRADDDVAALRARLLAALSRVVPFDAAFMSVADPDTLLFTSAFADDPLVAAGPLFLDNEFGAHRDINRFADLATARDPVASLDAATGGQRTASPRWREIMAPLGMGDELRAALRVDGTVWGFLCLHRSVPTSFTARELAALRAVVPHAGEAIRRIVAAGLAPVANGEVPRAVILVAEGVVVAVAGEVEELAASPIGVGVPLPLPLAAVVKRFEEIEAGDGGSASSPPASLTMASRTGALVAVHAARLRSASGAGPTVLTLGPAAPAQRSSLLLAAHGLTRAQRHVATLVLQGRTTRQIMGDVRISAHTVQDHLKVVFDKVGVRSRRELVASFMHVPN
jgi:DNA-binding CsgD family transcriptional regulator